MFNASSYSELTVEQQEKFQDQMNGVMTNMINTLNVHIEKNMVNDCNISKDREEEICRKYTTFEETDDQKLFCGNNPIRPLPYTEAEAAEMNANPEKAKKP